jgi:hypothetical protein
MLPSIKPVLCFSDVSTTAAGTATGRVDTLGYNFLQLNLLEATANVVSNKPTVLKITESDTTNLTDAVAIVKFTGGTATSTSVGFVIAAANTSATSITSFNIDLRGRKRYLFLSVSPATTQIVGAWGFLARAKEAPATAALAGTKQIIEG